jgi:hypothetical protein
MTSTSSISNELPQDTFHELTNNSKKRKASEPSNNSANKKIVMIWSHQEILTLVQVLKNSFANNSMTSMRGKWASFTDNFNKEANTSKTSKQVYRKISLMFSKGDYLHTPFKTLLAEKEPPINQNTVTAKTNTQPPSQASSSTQKPQTTTTLFFPSYSISPKEKEMERLTHSCFIAYFEGYKYGKQKHIEKKEQRLKGEKGEFSHLIAVVDFNNTNSYKLKLKEQGFQLGYACAIRRLIDANTQKQDFNYLYPSGLEDLSSIDLFCYLKATQDTLERCDLEDQMNFIKGADTHTSIMPLFDDMNDIFKRSIRDQIYTLFLTNSILEINEARRKKQLVEELEKSNDPFDLGVDSSFLDVP